MRMALRFFDSKVSMKINLNIKSFGVRGGSERPQLNSNSNFIFVYLYYASFIQINKDVPVTFIRITPAQALSRDYLGI